MNFGKFVVFLFLIQEDAINAPWKLSFYKGYDGDFIHIKNIFLITESEIFLMYFSHQILVEISGLSMSSCILEIFTYIICYLTIYGQKARKALSDKPVIYVIWYEYDMHILFSVVLVYINMILFRFITKK